MSIFLINTGRALVIFGVLITTLSLARMSKTDLSLADRLLDEPFMIIFDRISEDRRKLCQNLENCYDILTFKQLFETECPSIIENQNKMKGDINE